MEFERYIPELKKYDIILFLHQPMTSGQPLKIVQRHMAHPVVYIYFFVNRSITSYVILTTMYGTLCGTFLLLFTFVLFREAFILGTYSTNFRGRTAKHFFFEITSFLVYCFANLRLRFILSFDFSNENEYQNGRKKNKLFFRQ